MPLSAYLRDRLLNKAFRGENFSTGALWLSLHTDDPGDSGANEFHGNGYQRQAVTFREAIDAVVSSEKRIDFPDMPEGSVIYFGLWDDAGNFLGGNIMAEIRSVRQNDTYRLPAGNVQVSFI